MAVNDKALTRLLAALSELGYNVIGVVAEQEERFTDDRDRSAGLSTLVELKIRLGRATRS